MISVTNSFMNYPIGLMDWYTSNWYWSRKRGWWFSSSIGPSEERSDHTQTQSNPRVPKLALCAIKNQLDNFQIPTSLGIRHNFHFGTQWRMHLIKMYTVWQISGARRSGWWPKYSDLHARNLSLAGPFASSCWFFNYQVHLIFTSCKVPYFAHTSTLSVPAHILWPR